MRSVAVGANDASLELGNQAVDFLVAGVVAGHQPLDDLNQTLTLRHATSVATLRTWAG